MTITNMATMRNGQTLKQSEPVEVLAGVQYELITNCRLLVVTLSFVKKAITFRRLNLPLSSGELDKEENCQLAPLETANISPQVMHNIQHFSHKYDHIP